VKFLADMGISPRTVAYLREHAHEAIRLDALGMERATDSIVVAYAASKGSIVLTCDLDYPEIIALAHAQSPSLIVFRLRDETAENINRLLGRFLPEVESQLLAGAIVIVEEDRIRVRLLPIE
jgi:predicted nuclease of predicted toxin-antitoxin system